jgi:hypothetical protein
MSIGKLVDVQRFTLRAVWDGEASVWVAASDAVSGLVTEGSSQETLALKLTSLVPELLGLNDRRINRAMQYRRDERISVPA